MTQISKTSAMWKKVRGELRRELAFRFGDRIEDFYEFADLNLPVEQREKKNFRTQWGKRPAICDRDASENKNAEMWKRLDEQRK